MPFVMGTKTRVYFNALDVSGYMNSASMSGTADTAETSTFGVSAKTYVAGQGDRTLSFEGFYDPALTQLETALAVDGGVLTFCPGGAATIGDLAWMSAISATAFDQSAAIGDAVSFSWEVQPSGLTAFGNVLHPLGVDTGTTTGASYDQTGAQTATGWTAQLHVTAVSSGSWVVTIEDSSTGSSGWAAIATFTAKTAAGQQRLLSAAATTVAKRYIRYVATVTGGSTPTITFHLSFARSVQI